MRRNCERPGCAEPASVAFGMIAEDLAVWMEAVDPSTLGEVRPGLLCTRHADAMVVPKGWTLDDRREPVPRLFRVPERPASSRRPGDNTARLRRPRPEDWARLALFDEPEVDSPPALEADQPAIDDQPVTRSTDSPEPAPAPAVETEAPVESESGETAEPWRPQFDRSDDLGGLLTARSPLLRRAFGLAEEGDDGGRPR